MEQVLSKKTRRAPWLKFSVKLWIEMNIRRAQNSLDLFCAAAQTGDYGRNPGRHSTHFINDPEAVAQILLTNEANYTKKDSHYKVIESLLGPGLLSSSGPEWHKTRVQTRGQFHQDPSARTFPTVVEITDRCLDKWSKRLGQSIDIAPEVSKILLEIASMSLFGGDVQQYTDKAIPEIRFANWYMVKSKFINCKLPTPKNRHFRSARDFIDNLVLKMINPPHLATAPEEPLLKCLWNEEHHSQEEKTRNLNEGKNFLIAGHETTGASLTWTLYLLSKHPKILSEVQEEIDTVLKGKPPSLEQLDELKLTTMVIQESLRLYPPVWVIDRRVVEEDIVGGYRIPAKSTVILVPYLLHRHPRYWTNPEEFDPQRFNKNNEQKHHKFAYIPFGVGPRVCISKHFAMLMMKTILPMILQRFELNIDPNLEVGLEPLITLKPDSPIPLKLQHRNSAN
jgi:cytochrome P450